MRIYFTEHQVWFTLGLIFLLIMIVIALLIKIVLLKRDKEYFKHLALVYIGNLKTITEVNLYHIECMLKELKER